ncbi:MAG: hypothetical protein V4612_04540 [Pseudomonadota bacterium]
MKDNFFAKAWRGEEKFWKVFLVGVISICSMLFLASTLDNMSSMLLFSLVTAFFLALTNKCKKNIKLQKDELLLFYVAKILTFLLLIIYFLITVFSMSAFLLTWAACNVHNGELCKSFF